MSKEIFSEKISEIMYRKIKAIDDLDIKTLQEKEEDFEVAICLAYMSLSKEKIIDKDIKNNDRLGRLTQKVDAIEIDKVFNPGFAKEMPKITYARENNNLWILDNIRDSIMHGACDIDEERKCFLINNNQYNRELIAEIPFSWFIAYAKNDILSKKIADKLTIKGYYYNKSKKNLNHLLTKKELVNNILYTVNIYGNKFNIKDIENRVRELFSIYSKEDISDEEVLKYKNQIDKEKIKYNEKYLVSFYIAKQKVIETIQKEFPNVSVNIFIDNRKSRFVNKTAKKMPEYFTNYDLMYNMFNDILTQKSISLLRYMSRIIENIDTNIEKITDENSYDERKQIERLHELLTGEKIINNKSNNLSIILNQDLKILKSIYLNTYGLSTLVINHETLYNSYFLNQHPESLGLQAYLKKPYLDYANKRKTLIMKGLEIQIALDAKLDQFSKCKSEIGKQKIEENIKELTNKIETIKNEIDNIERNMRFNLIVKPDGVDFQKKQLFEGIINQYYSHFYKAKTDDDKRKIRKIIGKLLDIQIEEDLKHTYGKCDNMQEVLTIIRNCFSHIGRIYIGKNNGPKTNIVLNDYDTNGEKSGEIFCRYIDLINLLRQPYYNVNQNHIKK